LQSSSIALRFVALYSGFSATSFFLIYRHAQSMYNDIAYRGKYEIYRI
jgi:hypothetical protein